MIRILEVYASQLNNRTSQLYSKKKGGIAPSPNQKTNLD
jgi:hypothetical protein